MPFNIVLRSPNGFNIILQSEIGVISDWTTYLTFIYDTSKTKFIKNSGQYGVSIGITALSNNPTIWRLDKIQHSSNIFHPNASINVWKFLSGSSTLTN